MPRPTRSQSLLLVLVLTSTALPAGTVGRVLTQPQGALWQIQDER